MDSPLLRRALALGLTILAVVLLLLLLWPEGVRELPRPRATAAPPPVAPAPAEDGAELGRAKLVRGVAIEDLPNPTEKCITLVEWNNRNVPAWVIEDNMDAQGMRFDDQDLACMQAGGLPDQVLDRAEQNLSRPQPRPR